MRKSFGKTLGQDDSSLSELLRREMMTSSLRPQVSRELQQEAKPKCKTKKTRIDNQRIDTIDVMQGSALQKLVIGPNRSLRDESLTALLNISLKQEEVGEMEVVDYGEDMVATSSRRSRKSKNLSKLLSLSATHSSKTNLKTKKKRKKKKSLPKDLFPTSSEFPVVPDLTPLFLNPLTDHRSSQTKHLDQFTSSSSSRKNLVLADSILRRQLSEMNLKRRETASEASEATNEEEGEDSKVGHKEVGILLGKQLRESEICQRHKCRSIAAAVLGMGEGDFYLPSSSSSDDIYESTKNISDPMTEKLQALRRKCYIEEMPDPTPKKKRQRKASKKDVCKCHKRISHKLCLKDEKHSNRRGASPRKRCKKKEKQKADGFFDEEYVGEEFVWKETVGEDLLGEGLFGVFLGEEEQIEEQQGLEICTISEKTAEKTMRPSKAFRKNIKKTCQCLELCEIDIKEAAGKKMGGQPPSNGSNEPPIAGSDRELLVTSPSGSNFLLDSHALRKPCGPKVCAFSKKLSRRTKRRHHWGWFSRSGGKSKKSKRWRRKEICSPKHCKAVKQFFRSRVKRLGKARTVKRSPREKSTKRKRSRRHRNKRRSKPAKKHWTCKCHELKIGCAPSEANNLRFDEQLGRWCPRRYHLTLENVTRKRAKKCGGMTMARCNCYVCGVKEKPWTRYAKKARTLVNIPYLLTPNVVNNRAQVVLEMRKTLRLADEEPDNLEHICRKRLICEESKRRSVTIEKSPFNWKWCDRTDVPKTAGVVTTDDGPGKFGYYVEINEERLTRDESDSAIQKLVEKAAFCKWNQDLAEIKVNHFISNMPKQQTCYPELKSFDNDRRNCYNPLLISRLADLMEFDETSDRSLHDFSFPPKLVKYQEPQLVGDVGMDLPETKVVRETVKYPSIYCDLFKNYHRERREMIDAILPPLQWTDEAGLWEMKVSLEPDNTEINRTLINIINYNEVLCHAINKKFCAGRYRLFFEAFAEIIRQEVFEFPERAHLLSRVREEYLLTMLFYDGGLEMSLVSTTQLWKRIEALVFDQTEIKSLENDIEDIRAKVRVLTAANYDLERRREEEATVADYLLEDQEKLYKKTNQLLAAQYEAITAGLLYDMDYEK